MYVCTIAAGQAMATPDTCNTPAPPAAPIPVPYVNFAMTQMASPTSTKVLVGGSPALMKTSEIPLTSGDEPGVTGGVVSGTFIQKAQFTAASMVVSFEGKGAARMADLMQANKGNAIGAISVASQFTVDAN
jgi:hypothetical protein